VTQTKVDNIVIDSKNNQLFTFELADFKLCDKDTCIYNVFYKSYENLSISIIKEL